MWTGEIDVHDDDLVRKFWEAGREGDAYERPYAAFWSLQAATVAFRDTSNAVEQHPIAAMDGDEVLGVNQVILPRLDNTHVAYIEPIVRPAQRRRGVGTALLQASVDLARAAGRRTVISEATMPLDSGSAGHDLLTRHAFELGSLELHRVLELPVAQTLLDRLAEQAEPHHRDYEFVAIGDKVPDELVEGYCTLQAAFNDEAPLGSLELEAEVWDLDRVRSAEARFRAPGRHSRGTAAITRDGTMVALTEMMTTDQQSDTAWQGGTLVLPGHRGHRLGIASKVANLRAFQASFAEVRLVHSWNAESNGPMVTINDALGFRPVERLAEMQLKI